MKYRTHLPTVVLVALTLTAVYWGCDRMTGDPTANQPPVVEFVNVPFHQDSFNYAPTIYWTGYDTDGMITSYEYADLTAAQAVNAARNNDTTALRQYISGLPDSIWVESRGLTYAVIYLQSERGELTEHVFVVRCTDDQGAKSAVQYRTFFRSNLPPYAPQVKWALDSDLESPQDYQIDYVIPDTLFLGDTLTTTYPGIGFLWRGSDPDSRALNIIPLTFQWLLVNLTAPGGPDTVAHPIYNDSNRVVGWRKGGWSQWTSGTQVTFYGHYGARDPSEYLQSGRYVFRVRVRDDGLTLSDTVASVYFTAVKPTFDREVLIVDENKEPTGAELNQGFIRKQRILDFYHNILPKAFARANERRAEYPFWVFPQPFEYNPAEAWAFTNADLSQNRRIPYDLIGRYKWVWVINDNPPRQPEYVGVLARQRVMAAYLDVGGQVWLSGRRLFSGAYGISTQGDLNASRAAERFFINYFGLRSVFAKGLYNPSTDLADFGYALTADTLLPDTLRLMRSVVDSLRYRGQPVICLPEIDYFGRSSAPTGTAASTTVFNFSSCTQGASPRAENIDCAVVRATPSQAWLNPAPGHTRILRADRVFNRTKNVSGTFMYVTLAEGSTGRNSSDWLIVVSTPAWAGAWSTQDTLEVDYEYIPVAASHDEPVATHFASFETVITQLDSLGGSILVEGQTRYRTSLFAFPLSFMDTVSTDPYNPNMNPVAELIAYQILAFNTPRTFGFRFRN